MLQIFSSGKIRAIPVWLPGKQEPLPCPRPVLAQLTNSPGRASPSCPALQDPLGCAEDLQWGGWSSFGAIPRLRSPWNLGWSWDSHLPPATDPAAGGDGV